jgi:NAD+ diphosphatase
VEFSSFEPGVDAGAEPADDAVCFVFRRGELLIAASRSEGALPRYTEIQVVRERIVRANLIGWLDQQPAFAIELDEEAADLQPLEFRPLRGAFGVLDERTWMVAGMAAQVVEWDRSHQFCGRCGSRTEYVTNERGKRCPVCGLVAYPRVSPAVIVLVERGDEALLARGPHLAAGMYALIAGFVEVGESLEDAVRREIREEVGIEVDRIEYFASQSWPFPHSLMLGFTAQYDSGEIEIDHNEIEDARWFSPDDMPRVPPPLSIARKLIDHYADKHHIQLNSW